MKYQAPKFTHAVGGERSYRDNWPDIFKKEDVEIMGALVGTPEGEQFVPGTELPKWRHVMCDVCWYKDNPNRIPMCVPDFDPEACCYCGAMTRSGIYAMLDPSTVPCGGFGGTHPRA
jgi:hypothetical protein